MIKMILHLNDGLSFHPKTYALAVHSGLVFFTYKILLSYYMIFRTEPY